MKHSIAEHRLSAEEVQQRAKDRKAELEQLLNEEQKTFYEIIPARYQRLYLDALFSNKHTAAIKFNCLECVNFVRTEVFYCELTQCVFWDRRPYKPRKKAGSTAGQTEFKGGQ